MNIAVFIDREGVINKEVRHPELKDAQGRETAGPLVADELEFYPDAAEAFALLRDANLQSIVVSNQVNVAKGFLTEENLSKITDKLTNELFPNAVYYCTHHEDYTGPCECKKPKDGMLRQAQREHNIDLSKSYMVGDRRIDMQAGMSCKRCYYVANRPGENAQEEIAKLDPELQKKVFPVANLLEAVRHIIADVGVHKRSAHVKEAIVPCAGRGSGMGSITNDIPKPMIEFDGIPFLQFVLSYLKEHGVNRVIIPVGYKAEVIKNYFKDGSEFGIEIVYVQSSVEVESGGSFKRALAHLHGDECLMQYGDSFLPIDLNVLWEHFSQSHKYGMVVCSNRPLPLKEFETKNNVIVDEHTNIIGYDKKNDSGKATLLDVGVCFFRKETMRYCTLSEFKLADHIFPLLIKDHQIISYISPAKSVGIGNPEKIGRFKEFLATNDLFARTKAMRR